MRHVHSKRLLKLYESIQSQSIEDRNHDGNLLSGKVTEKWNRVSTFGASALGVGTRLQPNMT
jgi:hypothetical protein